MNNKGYLLVEIIVASVIAMSMMYFLLEITIKLKNINEDYYVKTKLETDQILMIKDVMEDILNNELNKVEYDSNNVIFYFNQNDETLKFRTKISITEQENNIVYKYGKIQDNDEYIGNVYTKTLDSRLNKEDLSISCSIGIEGVCKINMKANTIYDENNYGLNIVIPYSKSITINDPCQKAVKYKCSDNTACELVSDNKILKITKDTELSFGNETVKCGIDYVLVDGGSGGKPGNVASYYFSGGLGGQGGSGGKIGSGKTTLLTATYDITIGQGGESGAEGGSTTIKAKDGSFEIKANVIGTTGGIGGGSGEQSQNSKNGGDGTPGVEFEKIGYESKLGAGGAGGGVGASYFDQVFGYGGTATDGAGAGGAGGNSVTAAVSGSDAVANTGAGGGGGGGSYYNNTPGAGGKGGSGVVLLYYTNGWELVSD